MPPAGGQLFVFASGVILVGANLVTVATSLYKNFRTIDEESSAGKLKKAEEAIAELKADHLEDIKAIKEEYEERARRVAEVHQYETDRITKTHAAIKEEYDNRCESYRKELARAADALEASRVAAAAELDVVRKQAAEREAGLRTWVTKLEEDITRQRLAFLAARQSRRKSAPEQAPPSTAEGLRAAAQGLNKAANAAEEEIPKPPQEQPKDG